MLIPGRTLSERGQAAPAVLGCALAVVFASSLLAGIGGATTGASRLQRAADLSALSAARTLYERLPHVLARGGTRPSFEDLEEDARDSAELAARRNGVDPAKVRVGFGAGDPPLRVRVDVLGGIGVRHLPGGDRLARSGRADIRIFASATAEAAPPPGWWTGMPAYASGGGYAGPLSYRNGEGMRPDVATAFDRMSRAAASAGVPLYVVSGFRSDAEQAELFARHPDPRWVAPPGRSLHRCGTELDIGPASAYGWLAAKARRFGFTQRYSWEPWHYGFTAGPAPCSSASGIGSSATAEAGAAGLPSFVPTRFRSPIIRAAARSGVSAVLLASQLMAESGFDPHAVSPAGAAGIAQFMPATAREWGLRDRFDPVASIAAQARFMSWLLRQFGSVPLALAAYNAGPGAVSSCDCIPPYPETQAYVARILALMDGSGSLLVPMPEIKLVR
jgi:hypothetical protein